MGRRRKSNRHLPACVYEKHGAFWYVKAGKWTRLATELPAALREYARIQAQGIGGMAKLIEDALPHLVQGKALATRKLYTLAARKLQAALVEFRPEDVLPRDVAALRRGLSKVQRPDGTVEETPIMANRCLSVLRLVFDYAVEHGLVDRNPCLGVKANKQEKRTRRLTAQEYAAIRAEASDRLRIVMDLCLLTGQRIGDILKIERSHLVDDGIYVRQQKTGAELVIQWTPELRAAVDAAKAAHGVVASKWLVKGISGAQQNHRPILRDWHAAREAAGVEHATLHDIRAMAATEATRQGLNAQALLGHTSERMTAQYIRERDLPVVSGPDMDKILDKSNKKRRKPA